MLSPYEIEQILVRVRALHVCNPRDAAFSEHLDRLLQREPSGAVLPVAARFTNTGETRGIMVIDGPGGGKSTLVKRGLLRHPALAETDSGMRPYLEATVPSPATLKSITQHLLSKSGYPLSSTRKEVWAMLQVLRERLQMLGVSILWIDEAHDLFCADKNLILRALKSLMQGDGAVIVILSGTEQLAEIVRSDPQVQRRFSTLNLAPVDAHADRVDISAIIEAHCLRAGLDPPPEIDLPDRLVHAARQRFGRCIEYSTLAVERALVAGASQLELHHFAEAWSMQEGDNNSQNVFMAEDWWAIDADGRRQAGYKAAPSRKKGTR
jgi:hypothetical protein